MSARDVVRLRLARFGHKNRPFYRIVAAPIRASRDGRFFDIVGTYNPLPSKATGKKEVRINEGKVKLWMAKGAVPSTTVERLLGMYGILPMPPVNKVKPKWAMKRSVWKEGPSAVEQCKALGLLPDK
ncbi:30S ribosomal protein S16-2 [Durusdinium trenchii]|uniref:Chloroplastic/mitochondrial n=1 Tax=Durusdinium trenchii TaxID=1381693 RepID=A0ABP0LAA1_9DINO